MTRVVVVVHRAQRPRTPRELSQLIIALRRAEALGIHAIAKNHHDCLAIHNHLVSTLLEILPPSKRRAAWLHKRIIMPAARIYAREAADE